MIGLPAKQMAAIAGAEILGEGEEGHPSRAVIDSREAGPGDLFVGLLGEHQNGGDFAQAALDAGAWGALVDRGHGQALDGGWVMATDDPLVALGSLAAEWRRELGRSDSDQRPGAKVIGVTGSVGKTSVKDICAAILPGSVHASRDNFNTEIGLPLTILEAPLQTNFLVLEMAMRGPGQIAELAAIAHPDVGVITNVGPVHIELLGSIEAIAAVKAEILAGLPQDGAAVTPVDAGALEPHLEGLERVIRFGEGGDVRVLEQRADSGEIEALIATPAGEGSFQFPFAEAYNLTNALAAIAAGIALDVPVAEMSDRAAAIRFSRLRGERIELGDGVVLVNDCYNANPVSMAAALDHLGALPVEGRRIAVLGEMAELGPDGPTHHREVGAHAREAGVDLLVGVGEAAGDYEPDQMVADPTEAAELLAPLLDAGDAVLVKGSRSAGLELVAETLPELLGIEGQESLQGSQGVAPGREAEEATNE